MSAPKKLDAQTETQVVAMMARGDKYQEIIDWLWDDKGIKMSISSLTPIKERNQESLAFMRKELTKHEVTHATSLLAKSRQLIDRRLDKALNIEAELKELKRQYEAGEIDEKDYWQYRDVIQRQGISIKELTSLSKETFNQSQIEAGKPTSIVESPEEARRNLQTLLQAINSGDQQSMVKAIFPDA